MSRARLRLFLIVFCVLDLAAALICLLPRPVPDVDLAAINAAVQNIETQGPEAAASSQIPCTVLDEKGAVIFREGITSDVYTAAQRHDLVFPVQSSSGANLLVIFDGGLSAQIPAPLTECVVVLACAVSQILVFAWILRKLDRRILSPYHHLENAATHIARGQFDFPLPYEKGTSFGAFTESIDLLRTELASAQAAEHRAAVEKRELISNLSHELRTPLASMIAAAELGELKAVTPADAETYHRIAEKGKQLAVLSVNLLSASLADERELSVSVRPLSAETVQGLLRDAGIEAVPSISGAGVMADPVRLTQVFDNIMSNALKHGKLPLEVHAAQRDGLLLLEFEDHGGGVDEEELQSLRLRGVRGKQARRTEGAGIGLYICDQLAQAMDGQMLLQNGPRGLQVILALPLKKT